MAPTLVREPFRRIRRLAANGIEAWQQVLERGEGRGP